ncbi:exported hypothetical protein [uncultured delta proteobacterium]|uniref:Lipoprotein n=1 Tax=uncultured delta proteobacterium TaxID=34034 RepID=A0A212JFN6_9DELT|nr:exported hypothetical protein [uncultured delta proteobacterium]
MDKRCGIAIRVFCLLLLLAVCGGCASRPLDGAPPSGKVVCGNTVAGAEQVAGVWILRHKVRLEIPRRGVAQSFDGLMRLDAAQSSIRVTALGGLGMQLFDMEIGPDWFRVAYLHPVLKKIPYATEHIASCIRRIWFDCFSIMPQNNGAAGDGWDVSFSGKTPGTPWASVIRFTDQRAGYAVTVRLLQAQREDMP